jgi:hypothetical protein
MDQSLRRHGREAKQSMNKTIPTLLGLCLASSPAAWADGLPSLVRHSALLTCWTVTKACPESKGKAKIYDRVPVYGKDNTITTKPVSELKAENATFTFDRGKDYWIVFYPHWGNVNVKLDFKRGNTTANLHVNGLFGADAWIKGPDVTFATNNSDKAKCSKPDREKGLLKAASPFLVLD